METLMSIKLNKTEIIDKIRACWIGKNIGGTMGTPFEGQQQMQDIDGFTSPKGEPLPNDDLDLQILWMLALEDVGPHAISPAILSDYWVNHIPPNWNEYGVSKSNMRMGLLPPLTGEFCNDEWKNSNGAWIRSEIWACLAPGFPNIAVKYAIMDACVDHGMSEGTYAEMFTAALESLAFVESDIRTLIENALTYIPENCRVAQCVRFVMKEYDKKTPWRQVREMIVEEVKDLGWFQAPGNLAFVVLGLLYGEGDFKKTLIYAIDCGDDTDCTGATCGAILGIAGGMKAIPDDWREYIGDRIVTVAIDRGNVWGIPNTCEELTQRTAELIPSVLKCHRVYMEYTDGETEFDKEKALEILKDVSDDFLGQSRYSFEAVHLGHTTVVVEYEKAPEISPLEDFSVKLKIKNFRNKQYHYEFDVILPEGWSADYRRTAHVGYNTLCTNNRTEWKMTLHSGEKTQAVNRVYVVITANEHPNPIVVPLTLIG